VATPDHFAQIADIIIERKQHFSQIVVVVSAMASHTDELIALAKQVHPQPPRREYDMLVSVGERVSISLLAMALAAKNIEAISFTGSQSGIITCENHSEAKIVDVRPHRLKKHLEAGKVVIVAGFQGVSRSGEITTLGRGGSDTTAVAIGAALEASQVEFYKDVPGVFSNDPKMYADAILFSTLSYTEALQIVDKGAKVLHRRSILLAQKNQIPLSLHRFTDQVCGTLIGDTEGVRLTAPIFEEV